jgi:hypothetical protein
VQDKQRVTVKAASGLQQQVNTAHCVFQSLFFFFPVPVCAITALGMPGGNFLSMNRFSTMWG